MRSLLSVFLILFAHTQFIEPCQAQAAAANARPKLLLVIVIDQFRADYLTRFESRFLPVKSGNRVGGFKYLAAKGAWWPFAEYDLLQCMTGPGHATILTGSYPYLAGIPSNDWYDSILKDRMYCTEDRSQTTVGVEKTKAHVGTSPKNLLASTVGDELKGAGHPSRVISLALKDRAAILMGGHRSDLSVWMDQDSFRWVSSRFYLPEGKLPAWVENENKKLAAQKGKILKWDAQGQGSGLSLKDSLMLKDNWNGNIGFDFPHEAPAGSRGSLRMPFGLEITETLAEAAIAEYKLGQGKATDLLAVSFSSHDYLAHGFGPNSREMEEMTIADDRVISKLLNSVAARVPGGLANVLIVLTGDHGGAPNPSVLAAGRMDAGRIDEAELEKSAEAALSEKFGNPKGGKWLAYTTDLNYFFNPDALKDRGITSTQAENVVKAVFTKTKGIAHAFTATDWRERKLPPGQHQRQILKTWYPGRSGDVMPILAPYYIPTGDTTTHITGYNYDRIVPLIIAGPGIKAGKYAQKAEVIDIAPTLSFLTGTVPPSLSEGRVLSEAIR